MFLYLRHVAWDEVNSQKCAVLFTIYQLLVKRKVLEPPAPDPSPQKCSHLVVAVVFVVSTVCPPRSSLRRPLNGCLSLIISLIRYINFALLSPSPCKLLLLYHYMSIIALLTASYNNGHLFCCFLQPPPLSAVHCRALSLLIFNLITAMVLLLLPLLPLHWIALIVI